MAGIAALVVIVMLPQPEGLSVAGQHMLGIFAFAVIVWMTEALDYAASSIVLMALIAFLLGIAPDPAHPEHALGTSRALSAAMDGFTNPAVALIAAFSFPPPRRVSPVWCRSYWASSQRSAWTRRVASPAC